MKDTKKLVVSSLFVAIGTLLGPLVSIPVGISKCFPIQHTINILGAVILGPVYTVLNAFSISLLRNLMSTGTLLAFPGSMIGALIASICYQRYRKAEVAAIGEVIGTGVIGALLSYPVAKYILQKDVATFFVLIPFLVSSLGGAILAIVIIKGLKGVKIL